MLVRLREGLLVSGVKSAQSKLNLSRLAMLVIKRSATYVKDLKVTRHFPRVRAILQT